MVLVRPDELRRSEFDHRDWDCRGLARVELAVFPKCSIVRKLRVNPLTRSTCSFSSGSHPVCCPRRGKSSLGPSLCRQKSRIMSTPSANDHSGPFLAQHTTLSRLGAVGSPLLALQESKHAARPFALRLGHGAGILGKRGVLSC